MRKSYTLFLFMAILLSCSPESDSNKNIPISYGPSPDSVGEHVLQHIVQNDGPKPKMGDLVTYLQRTYLNDSLLGDPKSWGVARTDILPYDSLLKAPYNPSYAAMFKMSPGDSVLIVQPLKNVEVLPRTLSKDDVFKYEVKLFKFESEEKAKEQLEQYMELDKNVNDQMQKFISDYTSGGLDQELKTTSSGIQYQLIEKGNDGMSKVGTPVFVNFSSFLLDGKSIFSTYLTGTEVNFPLGKNRMIPGLEEMVRQFPKGSKVQFIVPPELGYGATGKAPQIPEDAEIAFYLEILNF